MALAELTDRERMVLEAVIQTYVATAQPAGSRQLARRFNFGVSPATIRNTMSDLEEKGYLFHPHTSAGRVPTDVAYRVYVDSILPAHKFTTAERDSLALQISSGGSAVENILRRAAQSLGIITQELGVALGPRFDASVLNRIELVRLASDRLLVVLSVQGGGVRTIYVDARGQIADEAITEVSRVLNERLGGLTLREVRNSLSQRLRDTTVGAAELINVFLEEGEHIFDEVFDSANDVMLGAASVLAEQPEFASADSMRRLVALTETRHYLAEVLRKRSESSGVSITIGNEHDDPALENFTLVTAQYHVGALNGVIGVIGPTRMPYDKVISLVTHTSQLVTDLLD
ncbi:MAG TPA: heat-inducible transcriptional repressor HrcA [Gemmatimonadaceae bacterium]|jgi:heat-inducible transcriptional repressor|nr:heat-inducible transcriptional repressor HrcA [Gemmatimonadaceae bacterium]